MHELIAWCGFVGGWLLVAGPIYQAANELEEEGVDREEYAERFAAVSPPVPTSPWWWLLPPVAVLLNRRRNRRHRDAMAATLTRSQMEQLVRFGAKATGWVLVAGGAFLIAIKETYELAETYEWPVAVFWILLPVMLVLAALYTVFRVRRGHDMIGRATADQRSST